MKKYLKPNYIPPVPYPPILVVPLLMILVLPITKFDRKDHAQLFENTTYHSIKEFKAFLGEDGFELYKLSDFVDLCNNEEFNPAQYWLSYIYLKIEPQTNFF